jgi:hypothetical protein
VAAINRGLYGLAAGLDIMSGMKRASKPILRDGDLYRAFLQLDRERRRRVALRILRNQRLLSDLYDHLLVQSSLRERGRSTRWEDYVKLCTSRGEARRYCSTRD